MRLKKTILTGLLFAISLCCLGQGTTVVDSILSDSIYRKYRLYLPAGYTGAQPAPLVFNLHGYTSNALQQQVYSNMMPVADTAGFLIAYPEGSGFAASLFWNAGLTASPNDVQFISELIDTLQLKYNIDYKRVYSCGISNGGIMSYYLACHLSHRITAIASVAGSLFNAWYSACSPPRPMPAMEIHGTADGVVPYGGDVNFASVDSVIAKWVQHNNCNATPVTFTVPNSSSADNSTAVNYKYVNGASGSSVELYKVTGGSHSWPGAFAFFPNTNQDFNASAEIWRFFSQYRLGQFIANVGLREYKQDPGFRLFPNPASNLIYVQGEHTSPVSIIAPDGRVMLEVTDPAAGIDIAGLKPGIYFVRMAPGAAVKFIKH